MARCKSADDAHFADAADALELRPSGFVGEFGQLANRTISRERDGQNRRAVVVELLRRPAEWRLRVSGGPDRVTRSRMSWAADSRSRSSLNVAMTNDCALT